MRSFLILSIVVVGVVITIIVVIILRRSQISKLFEQKLKLEDSESLNVEFEWTVKPHPGARLAAFATLVIYILLLFFWRGEGIVEDDSVKIVLSLMGVFVGFITFAFQKRTYMIASEGLYVSDSGRKNKVRKLFAWGDVAWIRPSSNGFTYYLKKRDPISGWPGGFRRGGKVQGQRDSMLINNMMMGKGLPTRPPPE